jgi:prevent-host-death family protein
VDCIVYDMKTIGVTDLRQRTSEVLDGIAGSAEPVAILQRSRKVAYLVDADTYDADRAELANVRRQLFLREVREAEAEYVTSAAKEYEDVDELIADLGLAD